MSRTSKLLILRVHADFSYSTREIRTIIRGLEGINLVSADIVEVAPAYV